MTARASARSNSNCARSELRLSNLRSSRRRDTNWFHRACRTGLLIPYRMRLDGHRQVGAQRRARAYVDHGRHAAEQACIHATLGYGDALAAALHWPWEILWCGLLAGRGPHGRVWHSCVPAYGEPKPHLHNRARCALRSCTLRHRGPLPPTRQHGTPPHAALSPAARYWSSPRRQSWPNLWLNPSTSMPT